MKGKFLKDWPCILKSYSITDLKELANNSLILERLKKRQTFFLVVFLNLSQMPLQLLSNVLRFPKAYFSLNFTWLFEKILEKVDQSKTVVWKLLTEQVTFLGDGEGKSIPSLHNIWLYTVVWRGKLHNCGSFHVEFGKNNSIYKIQNYKNTNTFKPWISSCYKQW